MKKKRSLNLVVRLGLFMLILGLGTLTALLTSESKGLALADLSGTSVQLIATTNQRDVLYAGLSGGPQPTGIYRSNDGGQMWQVISSGPGMAVTALAVHPLNETVLFAGTSSGPLGTNNVWRSDDSGQTWHSFNLSLPASPGPIAPAVTALVADPNQPNVFYVGTNGQGVYRFSDGQLDFELLHAMSLTDSYVKKLIMGTDNRLYALTSSGLFINAGDTWQKIETLPEKPVSLVVAPGDPQTIYVGCPSSGAYRSTNGGQTWEGISNGLGLMPGAALRITALAVDEQDPKRLVAATAYGLGSRLAGGGIYECRDGGHHWTSLGNAEGLVTDLALDRRGVYAATSSGLVHYGDWPQFSPISRLSNIRQLAHPTGSQTLTLMLAVGLAVLVLLVRTEWVGRLVQGKFAMIMNKLKRHCQ